MLDLDSFSSLYDDEHVSQIYAPSPPDQRPEFCTVFNHMVKSGGTTIKTQLEQSSEAEGDAFPGERT